MIIRLFLTFGFLLNVVSSFQHPYTTSMTNRIPILYSHDVSFLTEAYYDIKNVLVPHDVYSTVAVECANIVVRSLFNDDKKKWNFVYKLDSVLFCSCFLLGIPQTFNPLLIHFFSIQQKKNLKKETKVVFLGLSKWLIYNKLIHIISYSNDYLWKEESIFFSSVVATLFVSSICYFIHEKSCFDIFFKKEITQILFFEHFKQLLDHTYPLHTELPFASLIDFIEIFPFGYSLNEI